MIESIRREKQSLLLLDCGAVFNNEKDNAELHLKAMDRMGYDALNLGLPELSLGKAFLERMHSQVSFPYIASNLLYGGSRPHWIREYIIKDVGGIKVAILGIFDPDDLKQVPFLDGERKFETIPPKVALERLLPEIRQNVDLVVLLSHLYETQTLELVREVSGIDVTIFSKRGHPIKLSGKSIILLRAESEGMTLGLATITLDDKRTISMSEKRNVRLDDSVPDHEEILALIEAHKKEQKLKAEKMEKELMEGLQLTPEEFMRRYREKRSEKNKGDVP